jgi:hypothetical protein
MVFACEVLIKERLKSPSGYKRIATREYKDSTTVDKLIKSGFFNDRIIEGTDVTTLKLLYSKAVLMTTFIDYDAPNSFGTPVRGLAMCEYVSRPEDTNDIDTMRLKLDGQTSMQYMLNPR